MSEQCVEDSPTFDILAWWKTNSDPLLYPVLGMLARDVLAVPISTVASESAFSTGGRVIDSFRSNLKERTVQALVCIQDWVRAHGRTVAIDDNLEELDKLEEGISLILYEI